VIELSEIDGLTAPVAVCDACRKRIEDGAKALYVWDEVGGPIVTVHKGPCARSLHGDDPRGGKRYSLTLDLLPVYLGANLGLRSREAWSEVFQKADLLGRIEP
jgi:hypothetical protein